MADSIITMQELIDAQKDAETLEQVTSGDEFSDVMSRLGRVYPTLAKMMKILQQSGQRSYANYALFEADKVNVPSNTTVRIAQGENSGLYVWDGTDLVKSDFDSEGLLDQKIDNLKKIFSDLISAQITNTSYQNQQQNIHDHFFLANNLFEKNSLDKIFSGLIANTVNQKEQNRNELLHVVDSEYKSEGFQNVLISLVLELEKLNGFDPDEINSDAEVKAQALTSTLFVLPEPTNIVYIDVQSVNGAPQVTNANYACPVKVRIDSTTLDCYCKFNAQGSGSLQYPKKNFKFEFYLDPELTQSFNLQIGDLLPHDEWVYKANWNDATQIRNLLCYKLWQRIMHRRVGYPKLDCDVPMLNVPMTIKSAQAAIGVPDGFMAVMNINGEFYGTGTLQIGKKYYNYNLDRANQKHVQVALGENGQTDFTQLDMIEVRSPKSVKPEAQGYMDRFKTFAATSQSNFNSNINSYLNKRNFIEFWLFTEFLYANDNLSRNSLVTTYDGNIWYFMPYDLDSTFGLIWTGQSIAFDPATEILDSKPDIPANTISFFRKAISSYLPDIKLKYAELRKNGIFSEDTLYEIARPLLSKVPQDLTQLEYAKWDIPSKNITGLSQIMTWSKSRLAFLDAKYNYVN